MTPIVVLLRLMDSDATAMGKILSRVLKIRKQTEASSVSWKTTAMQKVANRWDYLKSDMHLAGFALDPENIDEEMTGEVCARPDSCPHPFVASAAPPPLQRPPRPLHHC
eukprot:7377192-Prymnesium_polylepis.2